MKFVSLLTFLLIPSFCLAITCDELQSPTQVREFLERSKDSNPILRRNVSTTLEIHVKKKPAIQKIVKNNKRKYFTCCVLAIKVEFIFWKDQDHHSVWSSEANGCWAVQLAASWLTKRAEATRIVLLLVCKVQTLIRMTFLCWHQKAVHIPVTH